MNGSSTPAAAALIIPLIGTAAILALTFVWALSNRRPVRVHARVVGRAAAPYWYSPTGLQDERGITALLAAAPNRAPSRSAAAPAGRHACSQVATEGTV